MGELDSGILNVNTYLPVYAPDSDPQFIEGKSFKIVIPLDEKLVEEFDRAGEIVAGGVKGKLTELLQTIHGKEGLKTDDYAEISGVPKKNIIRREIC